jgi:putative SOS response-associated peptidase YedK
VILDEAGIEIWLRTSKYSSEEALAQLKPDPGLEWYPVPSLGTRQVTHKVTLVGFSFAHVSSRVVLCVWCMQSAT